jgi:hypothetical protein
MLLDDEAVAVALGGAAGGLGRCVERALLLVLRELPLTYLVPYRSIPIGTS